MSHDSQTSSGIAPDILHRLDPRAAVHPDYYIVGSGREEVTPTCLVSDWVNFAQDDDQNAVQALRIRRRDLEDFIKVQDQDNGPHAPERVMPLGYWVINNSPDMGGPPPTDTSVTVILQYKTFRICICCMVEKDFVLVPFLAYYSCPLIDASLTIITAQDRKRGRRTNCLLLPQSVIWRRTAAMHG